MNSFNKDLISIPTNPIFTPSSLGNYVDTKVLDGAYNAQSIRAYTANPYKTNLLAKITNWVYELFYGRRTVLVNITGFANPLFVKVNELTKYIPNIAKNIENATDVIVQNNIEQAVKGIFSSLNKPEKAERRGPDSSQVIKAVEKYIPYQNLSSLMDSATGLKPETMLLTISEIGRRIIEAQNLTRIPIRGIYGFDIDEGTLRIYDENDQQKISVNVVTLETSTVTKSILLPPASAAAAILPPSNAVAAVAPSRASPVMMFPVRKNVKKMQNDLLMEIVTKEFKSNKEKLQHFKATLKKIPAVNILKLLKEQTDDAHRTLVLNTLVEIGKQSSKFTLFKSPMRYNKRLSRTFSYVTGDKQVILIMDNILGKGTSKEVKRAIDLTTLTPLVRVGLRPSLESQQETGERQKALEVECDLVNAIAKKGSHFAPGFQIAKAKDGQKAILQEHFPLEGLDLRRAFPEHQLKGLTDMAQGIADLHRLGFLHLDVKPQNCLVQGDLSDRNKRLTLKLSDFGTVQRIGEAKPKGTPFFMAPEVFKAYVTNWDKPSLEVTAKADSFSLGISIWTVLTCILNERPSLTGNEFSRSFLENYDPNDAWKVPFQNISNAREQLQESINWEPNSIRKQMLLVAKDLICLNLRDRISCEEAAQRLAAIKP